MALKTAIIVPLNVSACNNLDMRELSFVTYRRHLFQAVLALSVVALPAFAQQSPRVVHVFVALADNQNQGIIPVPAKLGNGEDPEHNLYWGSAYGMKTFFMRSADWKLVKVSQKPREGVLEQCIFRHRTGNVYLMADAYRGSQIRQAITDFLQAAAGSLTDTISPPGDPLPDPVKPSLVVYIGHEGFMDFQLPVFPQKMDNLQHEAIVLACISKSYFAAPLRSAGAHPLLWTTGLMAPEAYTLKGALDGWILNEDAPHIRERAAAAYHQYQHCGLGAARKLLVTGW